MSTRLNTETPLGVGRIIGTGWKLYTGNLSQFLPISLRAALWMFVPLLVAVAAIWQLSNQGIETISDLAGLVALAIPAWAVFYLFCAANSLGESAALSRLTYQQLGQGEVGSVSAEDAEALGRESTAQALRFTRSRKFSLLGSAAIRFVIVWAIGIVFSLLMLFSAALMIASAGVATQSAADVNIGLFLTGLVLTFALLIAFITVSIIVNMRIAIAEQSLAIEQDSGAIDSVGRSWKLMKSNVLKAFGALFLASLISLPVSFILSSVTQGFVTSLFDVDATLEGARPGEFPIITLAGLYFVNILIGTIASIIVTPFLKTVLTTVYFDVRKRKETLES